MSREPRRDEYTADTAVAPDLVLTVLTHGTRPLYEPSLVQNFSFREQQTTRSRSRSSSGHRNLA